MANRIAHYTQADVSRAVKGAQVAGLSVKEIIASENGVRLIIAENENSTIDPKNDDWGDLE